MWASELGKKKDLFFKTYIVHSIEQDSKIDTGLGYFRHLFDKAILKFYFFLGLKKIAIR